jgi:putative toxin-antitoxin system antitoxin component (TIGR02293 family)
MTSITSLIEMIGGRSGVETGISDPFQLVGMIRKGLPVGVVHQLINSGRISRSEADRVVLPRKTLSHREKIGRLTADQSDRFFRVARILAIAEESFGKPGKAHTWLRRPTSALNGETPLELLDTEEGAREVERLLGRIAHGIAA